MAASILFALLLCATSPALALNLVVVSDGDVSALIGAVEAANESGQATRILMDGRFEFGDGERIPPIVGDIELVRSGRQAILEPGPGGAPHQLIRVEIGARLILHELKIRGFPLSHIQRHDGPLIENHGRLEIRGGRFESMRGRLGGGFCCSEDRDELISNHGRLDMERTTFLNVSIENFTGGLLINRGGEADLREVLTASQDPASWVAVANLDGVVRISNATFGAREQALFTEIGAVTEMVNTIIPKVPREVPFLHPDGSGATPFQACVGPVVSLGHNLVGDTSCALDGPEDLQGVPVGTFPLGFVRRFGEQVPVIGLAGASPAVDSGDPAFCGDFDILGTSRFVDGDNNGSRLCDRGALELSQRRLSDGGINGFYFVPEEDGHYITVLDNPNNVLVIWNTFDREGSTAWIFGVGELVNGRSVVAQAFTNEHGVLTDAGPIDIERAIPWGSLTLELDSCSRGRLLFDSDRPEFGAGEFRFRRLATTRQLGCVD